MLRDGEATKRWGAGEAVFTVHYVLPRWEQFGCVYYATAEDAARWARRDVNAYAAEAAKIVRITMLPGARFAHDVAETVRRRVAK